MHELAPAHCAALAPRPDVGALRRQAAQVAARRVLSQRVLECDDSRRRRVPAPLWAPAPVAANGDGARRALADAVTLRRARRVRRPHRVWRRPRVRYLGVRVAHMRRHGDALEAHSIKRHSWPPDSYMASLFTDAHVNFTTNVLDNPEIMTAAATAAHFDIGSPCIDSTTSVSVLPDLSARYERFCTNPNHDDACSKNLLCILHRCAQNGSRGWESSLKLALGLNASKLILHKVFTMGLIGSHPQLHPSARPDYMRAPRDGLLDAHGKPAATAAAHGGTSATASACGSTARFSTKLRHARRARAHNPAALGAPRARAGAPRRGPQPRPRRPSSGPTPFATAAAALADVQRAIVPPRHTKTKPRRNRKLIAASPASTRPPTPAPTIKGG